MTFHNQYVLLKQAQTSPEIKKCQDYSDTVLLKEILIAQGEGKSPVLVEKLTMGKQQQELLLCAGVLRNILLDLHYRKCFCTIRSHCFASQKESRIENRKLLALAFLLALFHLFLQSFNSDIPLDTLPICCQSYCCGFIYICIFPNRYQDQSILSLQVHTSNWILNIPM